MAAILENKFRFAYRIRVENVSDQCVQLLGRYWRIQELTPEGEEDDSKETVVVDSPATGAGRFPVSLPCLKPFFSRLRSFVATLSWSFARATTWSSLRIHERDGLGQYERCHVWTFLHGKGAR